MSSSGLGLGGSGSGGPAITRESPKQWRETASLQVLPARSRPLEQAGAGGAGCRGRGVGGVSGQRRASGRSQSAAPGTARVQVQPCCGAHAQRHKNKLEDWSSVPALPLIPASCRIPILFPVHVLHFPPSLLAHRPLALSLLFLIQNFFPLSYWQCFCAL